MFVFSLIVIAITLLYVYVHMTEKSRQIDRMFPGPFRIPILGTLLFDVFLKNYKDRKGMTQIYNYRPYRLWFVNKPYIMISDYKTAKIILSQSKFNDKAEHYEMFVPLLGKNHFIGTGEVWTKYKKHLNFAFNYLAYKHYLKIFKKNADTMCQIWKEHSGKKSYDIHKDIHMYVMDNLVESFTGERWNWLTEPDPVLFKAMVDITKIFRWRLLIPLLDIDWIFNLTPFSRTLNKAIKTGRAYCRKLIENKRQKFEKEGAPNIEGEESSFHDVLTRGILSGEFTDEEIETEIASVMFAGYESVGSALGFAFSSMAKHQDIQEKVYQEIKTTIEESQDWPDLKDINKMNYTEQVIFETLRCYTPFTAIGRYVKEDVYINDNQYIPRDTNVFISLSGIHKDPINWPNPLVFDPDRFSPENRQKRDPYAFVAFSGGPRKCGGIKYAMNEMKIAIATVLQNFKIYESDEKEHEIKPVRTLGLAVTSKNGFNIKLQPR